MSMPLLICFFAALADDWPPHKGILIHAAVGMPLDVDGFGYGEYNMAFYGATLVSKFNNIF